MNVMDKIRSLLVELRAAKLPAQDADNWALAGRLFSRLTTDQARVERIIAAKDLAGAETLLHAIEGKVASDEAAPIPTFPDDELEHAYRSFMKRLKVSRLADESKLGGRYTSGGRKSNIDAIRPPDGFPEAIWRVLAKRGRLRDMGGGFYTEA